MNSLTNNIRRSNFSYRNGSIIAHYVTSFQATGDAGVATIITGLHDIAALVIEYLIASSPPIIINNERFCSIRGLDGIFNCSAVENEVDQGRFSCVLLPYIHQIQMKSRNFQVKLVQAAAFLSEKAGNASI